MEAKSRRQERGDVCFRQFFSCNIQGLFVFHFVLLGCCLFIGCAQDSVINDVNYLGLGLACADVCQTLDQVIGPPRTVGRFRWKSRGVTATPRVHLKARARAGG